jgi:hypothetical protein
LSRRNSASANCRFQFQKRRQLFIRTHNKALTVDRDALSGNVERTIPFAEANRKL